MNFEIIGNLNLSEVDSGFLPVNVTINNKFIGVLIAE